MKKGQLETMGLVVIVIILVFIFMFALPFIVKEKSKSLDDSYLQLVANNLRSVTLNTNLCRSATVKEEILNCRANYPQCLDDCSELSVAIKNIIENSLANPNINYKFIAEDFEVIKGECVEKIVSSKAFIDDVDVSVELCYRR